MPDSAVLVAITTPQPVALDSAARVTLARESRERMNAAAARIARVDASPDSIAIRVGETVDVFGMVQVVGRDSSGRVVDGFAPTWSLADARFARFTRGRLVAVAAGTTELYADVLSFTGENSRATRRRGATVRLTVLPPLPVTYTPGAFDANDPSSVANAWFTALGAEQWAEAAKLVDSGSFATRFRERLAIERSTLPAEGPSFDDYLAALSRSPNPPPREVIEWQFKESQRYLKERVPGDVSNEYFGVTTLKQFAALSVSEAMVRYLQARDPRVQWREVLRSQNCDTTLPPPFGRNFTPSRRILGSVLTGDSAAWVLHAAAADLESERHPEMLRLTRGPRGWVVDLSASGSSSDYVVAMNPRSCPSPARRQ